MSFWPKIIAAIAEAAGVATATKQLIKIHTLTANILIPLKNQIKKITSK